ncbi:MAG: hypothetical protein M1815_003558 [Lichina confinis]|nr:MAG: hypothetical protein M1815_003558 [Lichina confinis]
MPAPVATFAETKARAKATNLHISTGDAHDISVGDNNSSSSSSSSYSSSESTTNRLPPLKSSSPSPRSRRGSQTNRHSFVSVREDDGGIAQTFVVSNEPAPDAWNRPVDEAALLEESPPNRDETNASTNMAAVMTLAPQPALCCPCGRLDRWKAIRLRGRRMSRSTEDLRARRYEAAQLRLHDDFEAEQTLEQTAPAPAPAPVDPVRPAPPTYPVGRSPLESLPPEIMEQVLVLLMVDIPSNGSAHRNVDLVSCLLASRTLAVATLNVLYRHVTLPHSLIFSKFLAGLDRYPALGTLVRRLDFSHFTSVGLGRTRRMNAQIGLLTSSTLTRCLDLTPRLREFVVQEHLQGDIDSEVLRRLFGGLPLMEALDFCGCSEKTFRDAMACVLAPANPALPASLTVRRLSLHECGSLPPSVFETLLPRLPRLTHLDVAHTAVTAAALSRLPATARLTHLNLSRCGRLTGPAIVTFVTTHPAATDDSLVYLNLQSDPSRYRMLAADDITGLLGALPSTLRALNLSGSEIVPEHLPALRPLVTHLEELGLAHAKLSLDDIQSLWRSPNAADSHHGGGGGRNDEGAAEAAWTSPSLHYLDLTSVSAVTPAALLSSSCTLLQRQTRPLQVIELSTKTVAVLPARLSANARQDWVGRDIGRRAWYVRAKPSDASVEEDRRPWKMGALWWGMRKIPVARSEVGGIYGHYMFKR